MMISGNHVNDLPSVKVFDLPGGLNVLKFLVAAFTLTTFAPRV
jgi:hypothetical protein